jgi:hypothetical protein
VRREKRVSCDELNTLSPISDTKISVNAAVKPDFASIATTADGCPLKKTIKADARTQRSKAAPTYCRYRDPESGFAL